MPSPTAFQEKVYTAVASIPRGKVTTYAGLARAIGCASPRAIGQALKRNPFAPHVPCHRVIRSDGRLGGYFGQEQGEALAKKETLLRSEGVTFETNRRVTEACILRA